ncbi:hypothetical protein MXB_2048 [Myxobolus squamalis]|nr:hypothetical protein MXB_2048 [Myxobolus squamalis]
MSSCANQEKVPPDPAYVSDPEPENEPINSYETSSNVEYSIWNYFAARFIATLPSSQLLSSENDNYAIDAEDRLTNKYYRYYVETENNCKIWTLSSVPHTQPIAEKFCDPNLLPVLMLHGLLAGLGFWVMNFDTIVDAGHDLYAIDLPGFGRSSRIEFSEDAEETETIFVEKIEQWRKKIGLTRMIIIGHSFGGFITTAYALAYPQYTVKILLVDPWGFPDAREELTEVIEYGQHSALSTPLTSLPLWVRILVIFLMPFSPFTFLRLSGSYIAPKLIHFLRPDMTRRYACIFGDNDTLTVPNYIFHTNKMSPTGENAFRSMAMPLAWAKKPLIKRISQLHSDVSLSFIYGSRSWIDFQTGFQVKNILKKSNVHVHIIDGAGHHLFADEPEIFNSLILQIIQGTSSSQDRPTDVPIQDLRVIPVKDNPLEYID